MVYLVFRVWTNGSTSIALGKWNISFHPFDSFTLFQNHDFFHALTGLPPTVLGELGLKWLELFQTGLPIAALSCTVGSLRLSEKERQILQGSYLPWAMKQRTSFLMNVYYEKEFDTPIIELRKRLNLVAAPSF